MSFKYENSILAVHNNWLGYGKKKSHARSWKMSGNPASFISLCNRAKRDISVQTRSLGGTAVSHQTFCLIIVASRLFGPSFLVCSVIVATEHCPKHCHCCFDPPWFVDLGESVHLH